jgi:hypothetical protein
MAERAGKDVVVREAFRQYLESSREFLLAAEGFALKGWPDRKVALHNTFRLQQLFHDREALRFDHLTVGLGPEDVLWKSLSSMSNIFQRIDALWNDVEEDALKMANAAYADILAEKKKAKFRWTPPRLTGLFWHCSATRNTIPRVKWPDKFYLNLMMRWHGSGNDQHTR